MGSDAAHATRARQRQAAARVDALIATLGQRSHADTVRGTRIRAAVRRGRRSERARQGAVAAAAAAELACATALQALVAEGLSRNESYTALGLTRAVGARRFALLDPATPPPMAGLSTDGASEMCAIKRAHRP